jgi:hypothetical protein
MMQKICSSNPWAAALDAKGFRATDCTSRFQRDGLSVLLQRDWLVAQTAATNADAIDHAPSGLGLWKLIDDGENAWREFHLPLWRLLHAPQESWEESGDDGCSPAPAYLKWIIATAAGGLPSGWQCPAREEIEGWLPRESLALRVGPFVRQGVLHCTAARLGVSFAVVPAPLGPLPPSRGACLHDVLRDTQNRWRMVRVRANDTGTRPGVVAEVDLTGAPHAMIERLLKAGVEALRWVTSSLVWSTALLTDTRIECRAVEIWQRGQDPQKARSL